LGETGLQQTCTSGNQKLLAVEGTKRVPAATHEGKGETMTVAACTEQVETIAFPWRFCIKESTEEKNLESILMQEVHLL
jgi:hypothetical protein